MAQIQPQKTLCAPIINGLSSSNEEDVDVAITVINDGPTKPKAVVRNSDKFIKENELKRLELCDDSQDSNRLMDFLMAENSAVDNDDRLRRSSQISSKTTLLSTSTSMGKDHHTRKR